MAQGAPGPAPCRHGGAETLSISSLFPLPSHCHCHAWPCPGHALAMPLHSALGEARRDQAEQNKSLVPPAARWPLARLVPTRRRGVARRGVANTGAAAHESRPQGGALLWSWIGSTRYGRHTSTSRVHVARQGTARHGTTRHARRRMPTTTAVPTPRATDSKGVARRGHRRPGRRDPAPPRPAPSRAATPGTPFNFNAGI